MLWTGYDCDEKLDTYIQLIRAIVWIHFSLFQSITNFAIKEFEAIGIDFGLVYKELQQLHAN